MICNYCKKEGHKIYTNKILTCPKLINKNKHKQSNKNEQIKPIKPIKSKPSIEETINELDLLLDTYRSYFRDNFTGSSIPIQECKNNATRFEELCNYKYDLTTTNKGKNLLFKLIETNSSFIDSYDIKMIKSLIKSCPAILTVKNKDNLLPHEYKPFVFKGKNVREIIATLTGNTQMLDSIQLEHVCKESGSFIIGERMLRSCMNYFDEYKLVQIIESYIYENKIHALRDNYKKIFELIPDTYHFQNTLKLIIQHDEDYFKNKTEFLITCITCDYDECVKILVKINDVKLINSIGNTLLHIACDSFGNLIGRKNYEIIKILIPLSNIALLNNDRLSAKNLLLRSIDNYKKSRIKNIYSVNLNETNEILKLL